MNFRDSQIKQLNEAAKKGDKDANNLIKRWKANNDNSKDYRWDGNKKKNLWKDSFLYLPCGLFVLVVCALLSLIWGAIDMGSSYTGGSHEFKYRNLTGWEVGFGPFYLQTWVTPYNDMPSDIKGNPGLGLMNFIVLVGYLCVLYGIFLLYMYATYDGSYYKLEQIEKEDEAIYKEAVEKNLITEEMEPLLYNSTQLKF